MSGRAATKNRIPGQYALSVGPTDMPAPPGWSWVRLMEIADLETGHTPSKNVASYWNGEIPWLGIKDARAHNGKVISQTFQTITQEGLENSAARLLPEMTVCLSRTASVGYAVIMAKPMATSQDFVDWICSEMVDPRFLMHLFMAENESLRKFGKGTTHKTIYFPEVKAFHICVPPRNEQRRIVAKIEALQRRTRRARAALDAIPPLLEKFRQSVLSAAFRGDLTADWRAQNPDVEPASVLLERIREERRRRWEEAELVKMKAKGKVPSDDRWKTRYTEPVRRDGGGLQTLPSGWSWARWEEIGFCQNGRAFPSKEYAKIGTKLLRPGNLHVSGVLEWTESNSRFMPREWELEYPSYIVQGDELVMNLTAQSLKDEFLGRVCLTGQGEHCLLNQRIARLSPVLLPARFCLWLFKSPIFRRYVDGLNTGSLIQHMFTSQIYDFCLPLPPLEEQMQIVNAIDRMLNAKAVVEARTVGAVAEFEHLERAILAKAFRGELVPQDPNDEPASKLLDRIRAAKQEEPAQRGRRRAKNRDPKQGAPTPEPSRPQPTQEAAPKPEPPLPDNTDLRDRVHRVLLGRGPLHRDAAIRDAASALRDDGAVDFQRLRRDGPLYQSLEQALDSALAANLLDEPVPGEVRAVLPDARAYTPDDWRHTLLSCLGDEPAEREDAIEAAAIWAAENMGLEFQRLRRDGVIVKGLKSALRAAIRRGEVEKLGPSRVRKART